jgi:hypothetical protein
MLVTDPLCPREFALQSNLGSNHVALLPCNQLEISPSIFQYKIKGRITTLLKLSDLLRDILLKIRIIV